MTAAGVRAEASEGVLVVTLDRPSANAVDVATSRALYDAFARLENDPRLRVGVLTGAGDRFFCAGWDLKAAAAGEAVDADHGPGGFAGLTELHGRSKPVIAAVNGLALGGGFELVLAADLVVAADHAEFGLPETGLGIIPDAGGVLRLPRLLPRPVAVELLLTGRRMTAQEALGRGLVNQVVPGGQLLTAARELAAPDRPLGAAGGGRRARGTRCDRGGLGRRRLRDAALRPAAPVRGHARLAGRRGRSRRLRRAQAAPVAGPVTIAGQPATPPARPGPACPVRPGVGGDRRGQR